MSPAFPGYADDCWADADVVSFDEIMLALISEVRGVNCCDR